MTNMTQEMKIALDSWAQCLLGWTHAAAYPSAYASRIARSRTDDSIFLDGGVSGDLLEELLAAKRDLECEAAIDAIAKRISQLIAVKS